MKLDWGFIAKATAKQSIPTSSRRNLGRPVSKSRSDATTKNAGIASTCPHTTLSAITAGLNSTAAMTRARTGVRCRSSSGASRCASTPQVHASARSPTIVGSLTRR